MYYNGRNTTELSISDLAEIIASNVSNYFPTEVIETVANKSKDLALGFLNSFDNMLGVDFFPDEIANLTLKDIIEKSINETLCVFAKEEIEKIIIVTKGVEKNGE